MTYDQWKTTDPGDPAWDGCDRCRHHDYGHRGRWYVGDELLCEECCQEVETEMLPVEMDDLDPLIPEDISEGQS